MNNGPVNVGSESTEGLKVLDRVRPEPDDGRVHGERTVVFLDLVGAQNLQASPGFLNALGTAINTERQLISSWPGAGGIDFRSLWFSDNLGASAPSAGMVSKGGRSGKDRAFDLVAWYAGSIQARFLVDHRLASRGGIAIGDCFHDGTVFFGPALVDAYTTESRAAVVPRLLLHPSAQSCVEGSPVPVREDRDGKGPYLDFLRIGLPDGDQARTAYLAGARAAIVAGPATIDEAHPKRDGQLASWQWLASYFDAVLAELSVDLVEPIGAIGAPW